MSEIQHVPPPSRYIPAREEWLKGWCGPVLVDIDGALVPGALIGPDTRPEAERAGPWTVYPCNDDWPDLHDAYKLARSCPTDSIRLDPRRPEVRDMLARALNLPMFVRSGPYAVPCAWWCGTTGRALTAVCRVAPNLYIGADMVVIEAGAAPCFGFDTSRVRVLGAACALATDGGLLLPPLTPGGAPILWSDE